MSEGFWELVKQMREAQREYFRTRDHACLQESKRLERAVDAAIAKAESRQGELFEYKEAHE